MTSETNLHNLTDRDPYNPHFYTEQVKVAEATGNYDLIVQAYQSFLYKFPLLHIYWNKWALLERNKTHSPTKCKDIFDHAVAPGILEYSCEMWQLYCDFMTDPQTGATEEDIISVFRRAIEAVGDQYHSDGIWSAYIHYRESPRSKSAVGDDVGQLFARVLSQPIDHLEDFFNYFLEWAQNHSIESACSAEEHAQAISEVTQMDPDDTMTPDEKEMQIRQAIIQIRQKALEQTMDIVSSHLIYELKFRRPYFHFKELDSFEIANWHEYLTLIEESGDVEATARMYERALIPGALCPAIWLRYAVFSSNPENSQFLKRFYTDKQPHAIQAQTDLFYHYSAFVFSPTPQFSLVLFERANATALRLSPAFQHKSGLTHEALGEQETAAAIFDALKDNSSAEAGISVAWHQIRVGARTGDLGSGVAEAVKTLSGFLKLGATPEEFAALSALLYSLSGAADVDRLKTYCSGVPLALGLSLKARASGGPAAQQDSFRAFLMDKKSKMSVENKLRVMPRYLEFLRMNGTIGEIREAQRYQLQLERMRREEILEGRREAVKNNQNLSEIQDRMVKYLEEVDKIMEQ